MRPCGLRAEGCGDRPKMSWQEDRKVGEKRGGRQGAGCWRQSSVVCVGGSEVCPSGCEVGLPLLRKLRITRAGSYGSREPLARLLWGEVTEVTQGDVGSALIIKGQCLS